MAPYQTDNGGTLYIKQSEENLKTNLNGTTHKDDYKYKIEIVWRNLLLMLVVHLGGIYGMFILLTGQIKLATLLFLIVNVTCSTLSITAGSHRLWAHKSYKARWPLRLFLAYFQALAFQNHIYEWVRDHRVHHKFCDTDADPHNSKRGFLFSHIGWLLVRKHRDVKEKGKSIDMSDMEKDWVVMLQKKHYRWLMPMASFVIPTLIPWYFWGENFWTSYFVVALFRYALTVNVTWLVNSAAHMWGDKPYDKNFSASNNSLVGILAAGEGWHNYHHAFPWDYRASELWNVNFTTQCINIWAKMGLAYDLKEASDDMIKRRAMRTGDGSECLAAMKSGKVNAQDLKDFNPHEGEVWGFDDKDMSEKERNSIKITNRL